MKPMWRAGDSYLMSQLDYMRGRGNPQGKPYRLMITNNRAGVSVESWLSSAELAQLMLVSRNHLRQMSGTAAIQRRSHGTQVPRQD